VSVLLALLLGCDDVPVTASYHDRDPGCIGEATFLLPPDAWWDYRDGHPACDDMAFGATRLSDGLCITVPQWCGEAFPDDPDFTYEVGACPGMSGDEPACEGVPEGAVDG
jgi:hypothetical protein